MFLKIKDAYEKLLLEIESPTDTRFEQNNYNKKD